MTEPKPTEPERTLAATRVKPEPGSKGGRPRIEVDWDTIGILIRAGNTNEDIAALLKMGVSTLQERFAEEPEIVAAHRAQRRNLLRTRQTANALAGSDRMLIHLGEHELGQRRRLQLSGDPDHPLGSMTIAQMILIGSERRKQRLGKAATPRLRPDTNGDEDLAIGVDGPSEVDTPVELRDVVEVEVDHDGE